MKKASQRNRKNQNWQPLMFQPISLMPPSAFGQKMSHNLQIKIGDADITLEGSSKYENQV